MTNNPQDEHTINDPSLFLGEAVARLRVAASLLNHAGDNPEDWDGNSGWAQEMAIDTIRDVASNLEVFEAACVACVAKKAESER